LRFYMGVLEIIDWCPGDIRCVSFTYLNGVLQIFDRCHGDIFQMSWRYLIGVLEISYEFP